MDTETAESFDPGALLTSLIHGEKTYKKGGNALDNSPFRKPTSTSLHYDS
jgi:hypothetical protein